MGENKPKKVPTREQLLELLRIKDTYMYDDLLHNPKYYVRGRKIYKGKEDDPPEIGS